MVFEGKVWKEGKDWLIEVPALDLLTQGASRKNALEMVQDAIRMLLDKKSFTTQIELEKDGTFTLSAKDINALFSLFLKRQRIKHGLTIRDVAKKMNSSSPTAYAQYESGKVSPTMAQAQKLLKIVGAAKEGLQFKVA
ncbi:MAG: helix-turn-helix domain-containing protein [Bdellovibrionales bacterium]|nr:helix-turn-helix domain-containing protein [Bdellovibrionales bacterium]